MHKLRFSVLAIVLILALTITACAQQAATTGPTGSSPTSVPTAKQVAATTAPASPAGQVPQYGGIFLPADSVSIRLPFTAESLTTMGIENWISRASYDTLLRLDEKGNLAPFLATAWNIDATNAAITLNLRKGVKFHGGTDFNAQAVKWSLDTRRLDYKNIVLAPIKSIDVLDDYTVRINLTQFDNTFLPALWFTPSYVSSPTNWNKLGKAKAEVTMVGTGPFVLTDLSTDDHATYVRNSNYWQPGKPYLDGINYRIIADPTTQELLFRSGQVDTPPIDADIQQRLKDTGLYQFFPSSLPPATFWALTPDAGNPSSPWANLKVRLAADYAIDKEAIARKLGGPTALAQYQWAPAGTIGYIPDYPSRKYDPAKAKQLLAEAGYPNGFKTTANVGSTISYVRDMELAVHEYWRNIGIDIAYNQLTLPTFLDKSKSGWTNGVMDGAPRIVPDWLTGTYGNFSPTNMTSMVSMLRPPELEQMMLKAKRTPDLAERDRLAQDINRYATDNCITIQVYSGGGIGGQLFQTNVHGVGPDNYWGPSKLWGPADYWKSK